MRFHADGDVNPLFTIGILSGPARRRDTIGAPSTCRGPSMKNPLDSLWGTVIAGLVLTAVLYYLARTMMGA
jgi:hypothetical protein